MGIIKQLLTGVSRNVHVSNKSIGDENRDSESKPLASEGACKLNLDTEATVTKFGIEIPQPNYCLIHLPNEDI